MGHKRKACKAPHPEEKTSCWGPVHDDDENHWAYVGNKNGKGVVRIEWRESE